MPELPKFNSAARQNAAADTAVAASTSSPERRGGQPSARWTERDLQDFLKCNANHPTAPFHVPDEVVICLPMPPTTNNLFAGTGKRRYRTSEYNDWIKVAGYRLNVQRPPQTRGQVSLTIEVEEPKGTRRMDLANREKACVDLLVKHLVIPGDDQNHVRELNMRWADIQGVRVTIRPVTA